MENQASHQNAGETSVEVEFTGSSETVAERLGVTTAGLRRLADIYDTVYPPIKRDAKQNRRRVWTYEAISRLERARQLVQEDRARSIKAALELARDGTEIPRVTLAAPSQQVTQDALLVALLEHVQRLEARMETMQHQLEAPKGETTRETELERMNAYLLGELERRSNLEMQAPRRPWWRWWG